MVRNESDETTTVVASWSAVGGTIPLGSQLPLGGPSIMGSVARTGRPARIDNYDRVAGAITYVVSGVPINAGVGAPIVVDGRVWGTIIALSTEAGGLPESTEAQLAGFTELVAASISDAQFRDDLRALADEQAALSRVATLVAEGADSSVVFDAVCEEAGRLVGAASVNLSHYTPDGLNVTMAGWSLRDTHVPVGTRFPLTPDTIGGQITAARAPVRVASWEDATSEMARLVRERGIRSSLGTPIVVEGELWGAL